ncbi:MAG: hypothetical protein JW804_01680 [Sedimentisphaerales bacterium]|nr:hypothetical protein [Sedimentisphaerales bacterium]
MVEGLWAVSFNSNLQMYGTGVLVLDSEKRVLGGDAGYYYVGKYWLTESDAVVQAEIDVIRYEPSSISVFGNLNNFRIMFQGQISDKEFTCTGTVSNIEGLKIEVKGTKKV